MSTEAEKERSRAWYAKNKAKVLLREKLKRAAAALLRPTKKLKSPAERLASERAHAKARHYANKAKFLARGKAWRTAHKESEKSRAAAYRANNLESVREYHREYAKERRVSDPLFRLAAVCRTRIRNGVSSEKRVLTRSSELIGCSWGELKVHLESNFLEGMTWDSHGNGSDDWHVDHKIPLASAKTADDLRAFCHFSNLQPLWATVNRSKGATMPKAV